MKTSQLKLIAIMCCPLYCGVLLGLLSSRLNTFLFSKTFHGCFPFFNNLCLSLCWIFIVLFVTVRHVVTWKALYTYHFTYYKHDRCSEVRSLHHHTAQLPDDSDVWTLWWNVTSTSRLFSLKQTLNDWWPRPLTSLKKRKRISKMKSQSPFLHSKSI